MLKLKIVSILTFLSISMFCFPANTQPREINQSEVLFQQARKLVGFIDALDRSPAAFNRSIFGIQAIPAIPAIVFLTTSRVQIDMDVLMFAQARNIAVFQSIACEDLLPFTADRLFMGNTSILNPEVYTLNQVIPLSFAPGVSSLPIFPPDRPDEGSN